MFDYLKFNNEMYQTKDTPKQALDTYKIDLDPEIDEYKLFHEDYESKWVEPTDTFFGGIEKYNFRWRQCNHFTGEIRFYRTIDYHGGIFEEYSAYFYNGILKELHLIKNG